MEIEEKKVFIFTDSTLENLVNEIYGQKYEFISDIEGNYDCCYEFTVQNSNNDENEKKIKKFIEGKYVNRITNALLNDLCLRNELKPGDYIIRVIH